MAPNTVPNQHPHRIPTEPNQVNKFALAFLLFIGVLLSLSLIRNITTIVAAQDKIQVTTDRLSKLQAENIRLKRELEMMDTQEYQEKQARDQLGYSKEGETVLVLPEEELLRRLSPIRVENQEESLAVPIWRRWLKLFL